MNGCKGKELTTVFPIPSYVFIFTERVFGHNTEDREVRKDILEFLSPRLF